MDDEKVWKIRIEVIKLFKKRDTPPEEALAAVTLLVGQLAATQGVGWWKMFRACWSSYFDEKKRAMSRKLKLLN
jgi:hypothetical protein